MSLVFGWATTFSFFFRNGNDFLVFILGDGEDFQKMAMLFGFYVWTFIFFPHKFMFQKMATTLI